MSDTFNAPTGEDDDALALRYPPEIRAHKMNQDWDVDWITVKARSLRLNPLLKLTYLQRTQLKIAISDLNAALKRKD